MHTNRTTLALTASLLVTALAACSNAPGEPQQPPAESTAPADPFQIDQPKNLKAINDPCQLLTPQQVQELNAGEPEPGKSEWHEAACRWTSQQLSVKISPDTVQGKGLRYAAKIYGDDEGNPTAEIAGYPAVHAAADEIGCTTSVGVSETEMFTVLFTVGSEGRSNPEFADPCKVSDKIAGMVLSNLPPA